MSRTADAAMVTYLNSRTDYRLALCYKLKRQDGTIYTYTEHDRDLSIDLGDGDGELTYSADIVVDNSEIQNKINLGASNTEVVMALLESASIEQEDVFVGLFDDAEFDVFLARWDVSPPTVLRGFCGLLSEGVVEDVVIRLNYRSFSALYEQNVIRTIQRGCPYQLGLNSYGFHRCFVQLSAPDWEASTAYTARTTGDAKTEIGGIVAPTTPNGYWYIATTAGTSDVSEPTWPTTVDATVVDGTVTWTCIRARSHDGTVTGVTDNRQFADTGNTFADAFWYQGYLIWNTGNNAGKRMEISFSDASGNIKLFQRMMQNIQVGDTYTIFAGCDGFKSTCKNKYDNVYWFGGFDDAPGVLDLMQTPQIR